MAYKFYPLIWFFSFCFFFPSVVPYFSAASSCLKCSHVPSPEILPVSEMTVSQHLLIFSYIYIHTCILCISGPWLFRTNATILVLAQAYWVSPFWWALLFLSSWQPGSARSHKPGGCTACTHMFRAGALCTSCLGPSLCPLLVLSHWILWKKALISSYAACCVRNILPISRG